MREQIDWATQQDYIGSQFAELKRYAVAAESFLQVEANRIEAKFAHQASMLPEEKRSEFIMWSYGDPNYCSLIDTFPNILRYSLFIRCYSVLENALARLAESCRWEQRLDLALYDLQGKGIQRSRKYLKKVARIQFPDSEGWKDIVGLNQLRNVIVHDEGIISDEKKENGRKEIHELASRWPKAIEINDMFGISFVSVTRTTTIK